MTRHALLPLSNPADDTHKYRSRCIHVHNMHACVCIGLTPAARLGGSIGLTRGQKENGDI